MITNAVASAAPIEPEPDVSDITRALLAVVAFCLLLRLRADERLPDQA